MNSSFIEQVSYVIVIIAVYKSLHFFVLNKCSVTFNQLILLYANSHILLKTKTTEEYYPESYQDKQSKMNYNENIKDPKSMDSQKSEIIKLKTELRQVTAERDETQFRLSQVSYITYSVYLYD